MVENILEPITYYVIHYTVLQGNTLYFFEIIILKTLNNTRVIGYNSIIELSIT